MFTSEEEHFLEAQQVFTDVMIIDSCLLDMSWCQVQGQALQQMLPPPCPSFIHSFIVNIYLVFQTAVLYLVLIHDISPTYSSKEYLFKA